MKFEVREEIDRLLEKLPGEVHLDLSEAAVRLKGEPLLKQKIENLLTGHHNGERILQELFGCGPLTPLLTDEAVTEIIVNGPNAIWFERDGRFFRHEDHFHSSFTLSQFVQLICLESRLRIDLNQPFSDGLWRGLRVHLAQAPLADRAFSICLRRHPANTWTLATLAEVEWATSEEIELLRRLLRERWNLMVIGPTGAGKTSVLAALLADLPANERVIVIEDTDEIHVPNEASLKLLTRVDSQRILRDFDASDLVRQSLRMRPARLVLGEVRGGEAKDLLLALSTGHSGSLGSLHAATAKQALLRLEMLVQMGAPQWRYETVRQLIHASLHALVVVEIKNGRRRLEGVYQICALEKIGFLLEKMGAPGAPISN